MASRSTGFPHHDATMISGSRRTTSAGSTTRPRRVPPVPELGEDVLAAGDLDQLRHPADPRDRRARPTPRSRRAAGPARRWRTPAPAGSRPGCPRRRRARRPRTRARRRSRGWPGRSRRGSAGSGPARARRPAPARAPRPPAGRRTRGRDPERGRGSGRARNVVNPPTFGRSRASGGRRAVPGTPTTRSPAPTANAISVVSEAQADDAARIRRGRRPVHGGILSPADQAVREDGGAGQ